MKLSHSITIVAFLIFVSFGALYLMDRSDRISISKYVQFRGENVVSIDRHMTMIGTPFYIMSNNNRIYEVVSDKRKYWFRKGNLFGDDIITE